MHTILLAWAISAGAIVVLAILLGLVGRGRPLGVLVDSRGRYSLAQFQLVAWTTLLVSLFSGVFWGRLLHGVRDPYAFGIPPSMIAVLGISLASTMMSGVVKASKDATYAECVAASDRRRDLPRLSQLFMQEEGPFADRVVDITKFQSFVITLVLIVGYTALTISSIHHAVHASSMTTLPDISGAFLSLLGISQAGYLAGKIPVASGGNPAPGLTVADLATDAMPDQPRNPPRALLRATRNRRGRRGHDAPRHSPPGYPVG